MQRSIPVCHFPLRNVVDFATTWAHRSLYMPYETRKVDNEMMRSSTSEIVYRNKHELTFDTLFFFHFATIVRVCPGERPTWRAEDPSGMSYRLMQFNPPYTLPWLRTNAIAVKVSKEQDLSSSRVPSEPMSPVSDPVDVSSSFQ